MSNTVILLVNLGSPKSPLGVDVRNFLNQFLMDPYVIDVPWLIRRLLLTFFILPFRTKKSARAYRSIWTKKGSPLIVNSYALKDRLQSKLAPPVYLAMRYGNPSIDSELLKIKQENHYVNRIIVLNLYPHYADSTVKSSVDELHCKTKMLLSGCSVDILPVYYDDNGYIKSLVQSAKKWLDSSYDHLLFSYHGLPERHILKADPTNKHCLKEECCEQSSVAHKTCYRYQVRQTTKKFVDLANIPTSKYSISFQSRLGKAKWLHPYTEQKIISLAEKGIKKLLVICPSFSVDCLETLEEIGIQGKDVFIKSGGEQLDLIPCLNDFEPWVETVQKWIESKL